MQITKDTIQTLLTRNDNIGMHAVGRALLVLLNNKTYDEQRIEATTHNNNRGFTPGDARRIRITKYWSQLIKAAEAKRKAT